MTRDFCSKVVRDDPHNGFVYRPEYMLKWAASNPDRLSNLITAIMDAAAVEVHGNNAAGPSRVWHLH